MTDFDRHFTFCDLGEADLPASYSVDRDGNVVLNSVHFGPERGGRDVSAAWVQDVVGATEFARQIAFVERWWAEEGYAQFVDDLAANAGDDAYHAARDEAA